MDPRTGDPGTKDLQGMIVGVLIDHNTKSMNDEKCIYL